MAKEKDANRQQKIVKTLEKEKQRRDKENVAKEEISTVLHDEETQAIFGTVDTQLKVLFDH